MKSLNIKQLSLGLCIGSALLVSACKDNDPQPNQLTSGTSPANKTQIISGVAATGKAFAGKVMVKNKLGEESQAVDIKADGTFSVEVAEGAPYLIKATNGLNGEQQVALYSYLADASKKVNVTQLTTQAVYDANNLKNLATLYSEWDKQSTALTQAKIDESAKKVAANLQAKFANELTNLQIDAKTLNVFSAEFKPATATTAGTGLDKILDQIKISGFNNCNQSSCSVQYTVNGVDYTNSWNYQIDTTGYNVVINSNGTGPAGSGQNCLIDMDYDYAVDMAGIKQSGTLAYKYCYENFPQNASCAAGNTTLKDLTQASAASGQIPGYSITIRKFDATSVQTCPAGVPKATYK